MISSETPYKLADIIRDTWPQLYFSGKLDYNDSFKTKQQVVEKKMKFTVYSKNGCPYCSKIEQVLELANLSHVVYKLGADFTRDEFYAEFGNGSTFPQVIVDDNHLGGCSDTIEYLKENNLV